MTTPRLPEGFVSESIADIRQASDELLAELHEFNGVLHHEARPDEPQAPLRELANNLRRTPAEIDPAHEVVRDPARRIVAHLEGGFEHGDNEHLYWVEVSTLPEHRRSGLGASLLAVGLEHAKATGTSVVGTYSTSSVPSGGGFLERFEFEPKQVNRESTLDLTKVDWEMVDRWVAEGPGRAPGYELELVEGLYPESHYDNVLAWWAIMNTAPRDELSWNDDNLTKERLAGWEERFAASEGDRWELIARHVESGECVGVSNVWLSPWNPTVIQQGDTGVHPDHRGHAIGKWLKAAMLQKIHLERPEARKVRTENAFSNDAMLGINNQLGFAETRADTIWEVPLERLAKLLS